MCHAPCAVPLSMPPCSQTVEKMFVPVYILLLVFTCAMLLFVGLLFVRKERNRYLKRWGIVYFGQDWTTNRELCEDKIGPFFFLVRTLPVPIDPASSVARACAPCVSGRALGCALLLSCFIAPYACPLDTR